MSKYLIKTQEQWRVDSESEAKALIEEAKNEKTSRSFGSFPTVVREDEEDED